MNPEKAVTTSYEGITYARILFLNYADDKKEWPALANRLWEDAVALCGNGGGYFTFHHGRDIYWSVKSREARGYMKKYFGLDCDKHERLWAYLVKRLPELESEFYARIAKVVLAA